MLRPSGYTPSVTAMFTRVFFSRPWYRIGRASPVRSAAGGVGRGTGAAVGGSDVGEAAGVAGRDAGVVRRVAEGEGNGVAIKGPRGGIGVEAGEFRSHARASTVRMTARSSHRAAVRQDRFAVRSFSPFVSSELFYLTSHYQTETGERIKHYEDFETHSNLADTLARPERTSAQGRDAWTLRSGQKTGHS